MIRNLRQENDRRSGSSGSHSGTTGDDKEFKENFQALVEINHGRKKDYEELEMRYEMLKGEKRLLEEEEKELKLHISELEKRQGPLESELARLAAALYAQQQGFSNGGPSEEQCEILKSQIIVYKEDFERERNDREKLHEEKEKYKHKLENSEEIIRKLTAELDVCKAREESENEYISERVATPPRYQVHYTYPSVDQRWRMEEQRRGILPRNPPTSLFYGGDVEVDVLSSSFPRSSEAFHIISRNLAISQSSSCNIFKSCILYVNIVRPFDLDIFIIYLSQNFRVNIRQHGCIKIERLQHVVTSLTLSKQFLLTYLGPVHMGKSYPG
jgi:hypothetical protein